MVQIWLLVVIIITSIGVIVSPYVRSDTPNIGKLEVRVLDPFKDMKILPDTYPLPGFKTDTISITVARGEFESSSFVIRPIDNINNLMLTTSDLVGNKGKISKNNIDIKVVKVWYQGATPTGKNKRHILERGSTPVLVPELLLNDDALISVDNHSLTNYLRLTFREESRYVNISKSTIRDGQFLHKVNEYPVMDANSLQPFDVAKSKNKQIWVTIYIPPNTSGGTYTGKIELSLGENKIGFLTVIVKVLPFLLEKPKLIYSIYYRGKLRPSNPTISSEFKSRQQITSEFRNMKAHGIENPTVYQKPDDLLLLKAYLQIRLSLGMSNTPLYYLGRTAGNFTKSKSLDKLQSDVILLKNIAKQYEFSDFYLYGYDEARGKLLASQKLAWKAVQKAGGKILVAGSKGHFDIMGKLTNLLVLIGIPDINEIKNAKRVGNKIFNYGNPQVGPEEPATFRRNYGIALWQAGFDGAMPYAYQHSMGSIWNDFDHKLYRDHNFTYPTVNGVIDTIAWEGFREAVDDVRYISTLESLAVRLSSSNQPNIVKNAKNALRFLRKLKYRKHFDPSRVRGELSGLILNLLNYSSKNSGAISKESKER